MSLVAARSRSAGLLVEVVGHEDVRDPRDRGMAERRAREMGEWLVREGVDAERLRTRPHRPGCCAMNKPDESRIIEIREFPEVPSMLMGDPFPRLGFWDVSIMEAARFGNSDLVKISRREGIADRYWLRITGQRSVEAWEWAGRGHPLFDKLWDLRLGNVWYPGLFAARAMHLVAQRLCASGVPPEDLRCVDPSVAFWAVLDLEVDAETFHALGPLHASDSQFTCAPAHYEWFQEEDELIRAGGKTYALRQWHSPRTTRKWLETWPDLDGELRTRRRGEYWRASKPRSDPGGMGVILHDEPS